MVTLLFIYATIWLPSLYFKRTRVCSLTKERAYALLPLGYSNIRLPYLLVTLLLLKPCNPNQQSTPLDYLGVFFLLLRVGYV